MERPVAMSACRCGGAAVPATQQFDGSIGSSVFGGFGVECFLVLQAKVRTWTAETG